MKDTSFEQLWRKSLENASENPPQSVWSGINAQLDTEDGIASLFVKNLRNASTPPPSEVWDGIVNTLEADTSIEKQFQTQFKTASETPVGLWDKIEAELDEDKKPVVIWFARPWLAAGIAAALLLAFFLPTDNLFYESSVERRSDVAANKETQEVSPLVAEKNLGEEASEVENFSNKLSDKRVFEKNTLSDGGQKGATTIKAMKSISIAFDEVTALPVSSAEVVASTEINGKVIEESFIEKLANRLEESLSSIEGIGFSPYGNSFVLKREKLEVPSSIIEEEENRRDEKSWLGFVSGLAPFDPNIRISNFEREALVTARNVPSSFFSYNSVVETTAANSATETFEIPLSQPFNDVRPGNSINLGFDYGFNVHKNVSVEIGARYNRGVSFIESNVYNYNRITGDVSSFLTTHYIQAQRNSFNNTVISSSQDTKSAYQFLMVPVQLGMQLPLFNKFEAAVNAGVSGDFLVNNVLNDLPEGGSRLNSANSAYRFANISAIAGLSLNYDINETWQARLGGNFQQALRSGVATTQTFSFIPRYVGVNYGINYRLK